MKQEGIKHFRLPIADFQFEDLAGSKVWGS
jgi:hypothetical protein